MSKIVLLTGERGNLGRAFLEFFKKNHPDYKILTLSPFPFSLQKINEVLSGNKIYAWINCAALTFNGDSISKPYEFFQTNTIGVLNQLELIRRISPNTKYVTFGTVYEGSHISPYASSKRATREILSCYRSNFGLYLTQVTLGHTESKYRGDKRFLVSKIASKVAQIKKKMETGQSFDIIQLSDIDDKFSFAATEDVVDGVWRALNQEAYFATPFCPEGEDKTKFLSKHIKDYSFHSRDEHSIRFMLEIAFDESGILALFKDAQLRFEWKKNDLGEEFYILSGKIEQNQQEFYVEIPFVKATKGAAKVQSLNKFIPDSHNAEKDLYWKQNISFEEMIREIVKFELKS
jgi:GDP-D-mannose dehydratase